MVWKYHAAAGTELEGIVIFGYSTVVLRFGITRNIPQHHVMTRVLFLQLEPDVTVVDFEGPDDQRLQVCFHFVSVAHTQTAE